MSQAGVRFDEFYQSNLSRAIMCIRRYLHREQDVEEATQEWGMRLLRKFDQVRTTDEPKKYAMKMARNIALDLSLIHI